MRQRENRNFWVLIQAFIVRLKKQKKENIKKDPSCSLQIVCEIYSQGKCHFQSLPLLTEIHFASPLC